MADEDPGFTDLLPKKAAIEGTVGNFLKRQDIVNCCSEVISPLAIKAKLEGIYFRNFPG